MKRGPGPAITPPARPEKSPSPATPTRKTRRQSPPGANQRKTADFFSSLLGLQLGRPSAQGIDQPGRGVCQSGGPVMASVALS